MSSHPLDRIIQRMDYDSIPKQIAIYQRIVCYDRQSGSAYLKPPFWARFTPRNYRWYLVSVIQPAYCPVTTVQVSDLRGRTRRLDVSLAIDCIVPDRELKFVEAVGTYSTPNDALKAAYIAWIQDFLAQRDENGKNPLGQFLSIRNSCQEHVNVCAARDFGLKVTSKIDLPDEGLRDLKISINDLEVYCVDSDDPLRIDLDMGFRVPSDPSRHQEALEKFTSEEEIANSIRSRVNTWFRGECGLQDFCYNQDDIRTKLKELLKTEAAAITRELSYLRVAFKIPFRLPDLEEFNHEVKCEVEPDRTPVKVNHRLLVEIEDIARFRRSDCGDFKERLESLLQRSTQSVLFGKKYAEIALGFDAIRDKLVASVKKDVEVLGFKVQQLVVIPDMRARHLLEQGFRFGQSREEQRELRTRDPRVTFNVLISCRGKVKRESLENLANSLKPDFDPVVRFSEVALQAAGDVSQYLGPHHLFFGFETPVPLEEVDESTPVGKVIREKFRADPLATTPSRLIRDNISNELGKINLIPEDVHVAPQESAITERYDKLRPAKNHSISIKVRPQGGNGDLIPYSIDFRVAGIHPSHFTAFQDQLRNNQTAADQIESIKDLIKVGATKNLKRTPVNFARESDVKINSAMRDKIFAEARAQILHYHGLLIEILVFDRDYGTFEEIEANRMGEAFKTYTNSRISQLASLMTQQQQIETQLNEIRSKYEDGDESVIEELEKRLEGVIEQITTLTDAENLTNLPSTAEALPSLPAGGFSLDNFTDVVKPDSLRGIGLLGDSRDASFATNEDSGNGNGEGRTPADEAAQRAEPRIVDIEVDEVTGEKES